MTNDTAFYRRTPPALFPALLGFLGLALVWRRLSEFGVPSLIGEGIAAVAVLLFVFIFVAYAMKLLVRPAVVIEDLRPAPARGAVSAGSMCWMLVSLIVEPYAPMTALTIWWAALALHLLYAFCVTAILLREERILEAVTPVILLPYVGIIVAAMAALPLGLGQIAAYLIVISIPFFVLIVACSARNAVKFGIPAPARAGQAIFVAPISVYAIVAAELWPYTAFWWLWAITALAAAATLSFARWLSKGGFKPSWGAFTFPLASFTTAMLLGIQAGFGPVAVIGSLVGGILASLVIPFVLYRLLRLWAQGKLAAATGAAVA